MFSDYQTGDLSGVPAFGPAHAPHFDGPSGYSGPPPTPVSTESLLARQRVSLPGMVRKPQLVSLLVWPHGECDPVAEIRRIFTRGGMAAFNALAISGIPTVAERHGRILSATPFETGDKKFELAHPPAGFVPGLGGDTQLVGECWQIKPWWSPLLDFFFGKPETWRTFLVSRLVVRRYDVPAAETHGVPISYWETEAAIYVYPTAGSPQGRKGQSPLAISHYLKRAEMIGQLLHRYLDRYPASPAAIEWRRNLPPERTAAVAGTGTA
jgi:hypothetical protein